MSNQFDHKSEFIRRRQREREKPLVTRKGLIRMILVSVVLCIAFVFWADVSPESIELAEMAIFAIVMLVVIIVLAMGGGLLLSFFRKKQRAKKNDNLSVLLNDTTPDED